MPDVKAILLDLAKRRINDTIAKHNPNKSPWLYVLREDVDVILERLTELEDR